MEKQQIMDYYELYHLDRNATCKEIRKKLQSEQGKIMAMMSGGALNKDYEKQLTVLKMELDRAIKVFKNDAKKEKYDKELAAAYANGTIDKTKQSEIETILDEIRELFQQFEFTEVVKKCREAISENIHDAEMYGYMARSYEQLGYGEDAIKAADAGVENNPDNPYAISVGCRMNSNYGNDMDKVHKLIDKLRAIDPKGGLATIEEAYLNLKNDMLEAAFALYDKYLKVNPSDSQFRENAAYDLLGSAATLYVKDPSGLSDVKALTSEEDYNTCLALAEQAAKIYNDPTVREFLETTRSFGIKEFNPEFSKPIKVYKLVDAFSKLYTLGFIAGGAIMALISIISGDYDLLTLAIMLSVMGLILNKIIKKDKTNEKYEKASMRPRWAYYKYEFYGERELEEAKALNDFDKEMKMAKDVTKGTFKFIWELLRFFFE